MDFKKHVFTLHDVLSTPDNIITFYEEQLNDNPVYYIDRKAGIVHG
jgi:hypothetical protein